MVKSGLIVGGITLVLGIIGGLIFPIVCIPCTALFAGVGAGYLAGQFEKPANTSDSAKRGAGAGAIGGVGAVLAHLITGVGSAVMLGPGGANDMLKTLGIPLSSTGDPTTFYAGAVGGACCFGLFEVVLMAAVGALGGLLWYQLTGRNVAPPAPGAPAM
jgi:hypothetical protein